MGEGTRNDFVIYVFKLSNNIYIFVGSGLDFVNSCLVIIKYYKHICIFRKTLPTYQSRKETIKYYKNIESYPLLTYIHAKAERIRKNRKCSKYDFFSTCVLEMSVMNIVQANVLISKKS